VIAQCAPTRMSSSRKIGVRELCVVERVSGHPIEFVSAHGNPDTETRGAFQGAGAASGQAWECHEVKARSLATARIVVANRPVAGHNPRASGKFCAAEAKLMWRFRCCIRQLGKGASNPCCPGLQQEDVNRSGNGAVGCGSSVNGVQSGHGTRDRPWELRAT